MASSPKAFQKAGDVASCENALRSAAKDHANLPNVARRAPTRRSPVYALETLIAQRRRPRVF